MESRRVLSADPVVLGAVYIEDDSGTDAEADQFYVSFEGGSDTTRLGRVVINTSQDGQPEQLSEPDVYFDTIENNVVPPANNGNVRGSGGASPFQVSSESVGVDASQVSFQVADGGTQLVIDIEDFRAGDVLVFSIDVDQYFSNKPDDQITSGIEFAGSQVEGHFIDPHYTFDRVASASGGVFQYNFGFGSDDMRDSGTLSGLPTDDYRITENNFVSIENRTAGAFDELSLAPKPVSISGTVYHDRDLDLRQDAGEEGIEGVVLRLQRLDEQGNYVDIPQGAQGQTTTTTDADGNYEFGESLGLMPGTYRVLQTQPSDFDISVGEVPGTVAGTEVGSATDNVLTEITIPLGDQHAVDYDFAEARSARLCGYVYHDRNDNGLREAGEEGLSGVQVRIVPLGGMGQLHAPQIVTTDANGRYCFTGLMPGEYEVVQVTQPDGFLDGKDTAGRVAGRGVIGSAINPGDRLVGVQLGSGERGVEYNFGEIRYGSLSGYVKLATPEGDCVGPTHPEFRPIAGVQIRLTDNQGQSWTATTDENGRYHFTELAPGTYTIAQVTPPNFPYLQGEVKVGQIGGSTVGSLTGVDTIGGISLGAGEHGEMYNFCEHEPAALTGTVYHDRDNDGIREAGEEGISGVLVQLFDEQGQLVQSSVTNGSGGYAFTGLYAGTYRVVELQPADYVDGKESLGTVAGTTRGTINGNDQFTEIRVLGGEQGIDYDFGEYRLSSISGVVHADENDNCVFEPELGERALANVTLELLDQQGEVIATTVTDAEGRYEFSGLRPGEYAVRQQQPDGYFNGSHHVGINSRTGTEGPGDASQTNLVTGITLTSDMQLIGYDHCEIPPAAISGFVFRDGADIVVRPGVELTPEQIASRRDGVLTSDDQRLAGVVMELRHGITGLPIDGSDLMPGVYGPGPVRTVTDAAGYYEFVGLPAGPYAVFQIQPGGLTDHVDRPGPLNGIPVNAVDMPNEFIIRALDSSVQHRYDAILRINVGAGDHASYNNFSEVRIREQSDPGLPLQPPPYELPPQGPPAPLPGFLPPTAPTLAGHYPVQVDPLPFFGANREADYTWHLSVVDGGVPRGGNQVAGTQANVFSVGLSSTRVWEQEDVTRGEWIINFNDPEQMGEATEDATRQFGLVEGIPVVGDFNGDGVDEVAIFRNGEWFIDLNGNGEWDRMDLWAQLGDEADRPVVGDWDGDGKEDIGIFGPIWPGDPRAIESDPGLPDPANRFLAKAKNVPPTSDEATHGSRVMRLTSTGKEQVDLIDHVFRYGEANETPLAGDWNGDGIRTIGTFHNGRWKLDTDGDGRWTERDTQVQFGQEGDLPIVGDFNGDGIEEIGVYRQGEWMLDMNNNRELDAHDAVFKQGDATTLPVVGDFDGDGIDETSLYRVTPASESAPPLNEG